MYGLHERVDHAAETREIIATFAHAMHNSVSALRPPRPAPQPPNRIERTSAKMGSAALSEAVKSIREWSLTERSSTPPAVKAADVFGSLVFNDKAQQERLPKPAYRALRATITRGEPLDLATADAVATALKDWAYVHGARARRHPLHPLVPAAHRDHRREARFVSLADQRGWRDRRVPRQGIDQG
jgi:hypothetical protein